MGFQRSSNTSKRSAHQERAYKKAEPSEIVFEAEPAVQGGSFQDALICLYGRPKIGKSTLASHLPGAYFLPTEKGTKYLNVRQTYIDSWDKFVAFIQWAEKHKKATANVSVFIVDTVTILAKHCMYSVCAELGVTHPSDESYGKGWEAFADTFAGWILRLCGLGKGIMFICHESITDIVSRSMQVSHYGPDLPRTAYRVIMPICDIVLHMAYVEESTDGSALGRKRCLYARPSDLRDAGDRSNRLPAEIEFLTEKQAVRKIMAAYKNDNNIEKE